MQARLSDVKSLRRQNSKGGEDRSALQDVNAGVPLLVGDPSGERFEFEGVTRACDSVVNDMDRAIEDLQRWRKERVDSNCIANVSSPVKEPQPDSPASAYNDKRRSDNASQAAQALCDALDGFPPAGVDHATREVERARKQLCDADDLDAGVAQLKSDAVNLCLAQELSAFESEAEAMLGRLSIFTADVEGILDNIE